MSNRNPFALLSEDGDEPVSAPAPAAAAAPAPAAPVAAPKRQVPGTQQQRGKGDYPSRGAPRKTFNGENRQQAAAGTDAGEADLAKDVRGQRTADQRDQRGGRGSGRGGPRGGRGGRGSGGNRPMDRHSQTDRTDSHKQEHQAWGGDEGKRELEDENQGEKDALAAQSGVATPIGGEAPSTPTTANKDAAPTPTESTPAPEAEPEDNTKTYEEYLAERTKSTGISLPEARKANEGADDAQWKDAVALKKEEDEDVYYAAQNKEAKARKQRAPKEKTFLEFEPQYTRPAGGDRGRGGARGRGGDSRGGRGRGAPGGERGGRGRGAPRTNGAPRQGQQNSVDTSDASAFPSLS